MEEEQRSEIAGAILNQLRFDDQKESKKLGRRGVTKLLTHQGVNCDNQVALKRQLIGQLKEHVKRRG